MKIFANESAEKLQFSTETEKEKGSIWLWRSVDETLSQENKIEINVSDYILNINFPNTLFIFGAHYSDKTLKNV